MVQWLRAQRICDAALSHAESRLRNFTSTRWPIRERCVVGGDDDFDDAFIGGFIGRVGFEFAR